MSPLRRFLTNVLRRKTSDGRKKYLVGAARTGTAIAQDHHHCHRHIDNPFLDLPNEMVLLIASFLELDGQALLSLACRRMRDLLAYHHNLAFTDANKAAKVRYLQCLELDYPEYLTCRACGFLYRWRKRASEGFSCPNLRNHIAADRDVSKAQENRVGDTTYVRVGREVVDLVLRAHEHGPDYGLPASFLNMAGPYHDGTVRTYEARIVDGELILACRMEVEAESHRSLEKMMHIFPMNMCLHLFWIVGIINWTPRATKQAAGSRMMGPQVCEEYKCAFCETDVQVLAEKGEGKRIRMIVNVWRNYGRKYGNRFSNEQIFYREPESQLNAATLTQRDIRAAFESDMGACRAECPTWHENLGDRVLLLAAGREISWWASAYWFSHPDGWAMHHTNPLSRRSVHHASSTLRPDAVHLVHPVPPTMFNATQHRGNPNLGPAAPGQPNHRLNEILDSLRAEFDSQSRNSEQVESQVTQQIQEMELIRNKVYQLEQNQLKMKQEYENEIRALRHELELRGGIPPQSHISGPPPHGGGPSQPPPALGHGQGGLFSGIMANQGQGGPGLAPPPDAPPPQQHPLGPPPAGQGQAPPQPPNSFPPYQPGPTLNGYGQPQQPQQPQAANSPGLGKNRNLSSRAAPGPATPQQHPGQPQPIAYQADPRASPQIPRPTPPGTDLALTRHQPPPQQQQQPPPPPPLQQGSLPFPNVGNNLSKLTPEDLPDHLKKEGPDWYAIFNPAVPRMLDVNLLHNLVHESVVCCVRFSHDGRYVATGCNRSAQIFDARDGKKVCELQDDSVQDKDGDLYIRSVCFSPDGKLLATGAEDRKIRVWDIESRRIRNTFDGHDQDIYSLDFARSGRLIASGSGDKTVRLYDIESNAQVMVLSIEDGVTTVAMSPDGRYVAAGSLDKSVRVWDCSSGYLTERLEGPSGHKDSVYSVAFSPNGRELVSGSLDKTIKMWELGQSAGGMGSRAGKDSKCIRTFEGHNDYVLSVCLTPGGEWVMSGSKDRGVQFWDPATGNAQMMLQGHKNSVISVAPCPTGNMFATGSGDMKARIWSYTPYR
ncbi:hypothetical protein DV738_g1003, partial [Chaetothyriales sp. CBS 135597]